MHDTHQEWGEMYVSPMESGLNMSITADLWRANGYAQGIEDHVYIRLWVAGTEIAAHSMDVVDVDDHDDIARRVLAWADNWDARLEEWSAQRVKVSLALAAYEEAGRPSWCALLPESTDEDDIDLLDHIQFRG